MPCWSMPTLRILLCSLSVVALANDVPQYVDGYPKVLITDKVSATFSARTDQAALLYWAVVAAGSQVPTADQVVDGDNGVTWAISTDTESTAANEDKYISAQSLTPGNSYVIYMVLRNYLDAYYGPIESLSFTTEANPSPPPVTPRPTASPTPSPTESPTKVSVEQGDSTTAPTSNTTETESMALSTQKVTGAWLICVLAGLQWVTDTLYVDVINKPLRYTIPKANLRRLAMTEHFDEQSITM
ncbi:hypothetical protein CYMTET_42563 [Cymbomonas tetramitiformis]|uniref:Uncharacterized protein n=1 Tax=Cymbomonas tetramitiformis TaxID=36881 RepID=A0AAE0C580_9CHLO|nr:hypothetical protein CYMTET_42563 [Cymbomonas tetramitiformis]